MRKTKEDAELSKKKIVEAAYLVFMRKGYAATKLSDIAAEIKMTRGVIYWHFKNKLELFVYLINQLLDESIMKARDVIQSGKSLEEKLKYLLLNDDYGSRFFDFIKVFEPEAVMIRNQIGDVPIKMARDKFQSLLNSFSAWLSDEQKAGYIKANVDVQALSLSLMIATSILHSIVLKDSNATWTSIGKSKRKDIVSLLWNGFGATLNEK